MLLGYKYFISKLNASAREFVPLKNKFELMNNDYRGRDVYRDAALKNNSVDLTQNMNSASNNDSEHSVQDEDNDVYSMLNILKINNINRIVIAHLNINSLRYKFDSLSDIVAGKIDILLISETKLDDSFPTSYFKIFGYSKPLRLDRTANGGGILLYIREDIPFKRLNNIVNPQKFECFFTEVKLGKVNWLLGSFYNPSKSQLSAQLANLSKSLDHYTQFYDNILILGDFNSEMTEEQMMEFSDIYNLKDLVKAPTCFKNYNKPSSIDLMLTNRYRSFLKTSVIETGLSDFHKMTVAIMKTTFRKGPPKIITYREFKNFSNELFISELLSILVHHDVNNISFENLDNIVMSLVNIHAPLKYKYTRANHNPFINKNLRKAIMNRSRLKNTFLKKKTTEAHNNYKRYRNLCTNLLRRSKRSYFNSIKPSRITDNKKFWKTIKPMFNDNIQLMENVTLIENDQIVSEDKQVAQIFSNYFDNVVQNMDVAINSDIISNSDSIYDPILKAIKKFEKHPSIKIIKAKYPINVFDFKFVSLDEMEK